MTGRSRRQRRPGSRRWAGVVLATGAVLALAGGYVQFRPAGGDQEAQQAQPAGLSASPRPSSPSSPPTTPPSTPTSKPSAAKPPASVASTPATKRSTALPKASVRPPAAGGPERITVPRLGVSARVLNIRAKGGTLIPPSNPRLVGWWSDGARPGAAKGSAIITGHTVHDGGGAFDDLDHLVAGDVVTVVAGRRTIRYSVASVKIYRKRTLAKEAARLFDQSVPGRLVLVTCEDWNGTDYESNAVVVANPLT